MKTTVQTKYKKGQKDSTVVLSIHMYQRNRKSAQMQINSRMHENPKCQHTERVWKKLIPHKNRIRITQKVLRKKNKALLVISEWRQTSLEFRWYSLLSWTCLMLWCGPLLSPPFNYITYTFVLCLPPSHAAQHSRLENKWKRILCGNVSMWWHILCEATTNKSHTFVFCASLLQIRCSIAVLLYILII